MKKTEALIKAENLTIGFERTELLRGLNLELTSGHLTCLMGPNGIGKSTLIRVLGGLASPLSGRVIRHSQGNAASTVAVVLTTRTVDPDLKAGEMVMLGRYPHISWHLRTSTGDREKIREAMELTGTLHLIERAAGTLSDGQFQMVMIARAIAQDTPVILLDEPTSHLDLNNRVEIMNLLRRLCHDHGRSILISTHELDLALQCADQIWLADPEKRVQAGIPEDLVLSGEIDRVFGLKGFSLKTGKLERKGAAIRRFMVKGEGYALLWTRNALDRSGFEAEHPDGEEIQVEETDGQFQWRFAGKVFCDLQSLLSEL